MPDLTKEELWRQLRQDVIAPVYLIYGSEAFLRERAAAEIVDRTFNENDLREFNHDEYSLNDRNALQAAIASAEQLPMMSERRVVLVQDVRVAASSTRDTLREENEQLLASYLADPCVSTVIIFIADELNGNRKLSRLLKKHAAAVEFKKLTDAEVLSWIKKSVGDRNGTIDDRAARHMIEVVGSDLRRLGNEVEKLSTAVLPDGVITFDLVNELSADSGELDNWALSAAIVSANRSQALSILEKILDYGAEPVTLLGLVSYNFRRLLIVKEMMVRGDDRNAVARVLNLRYREQEDFLAAARRSDRAQLAQAFELLKSADLAMKTSVGGAGAPGARMQLEVLLCEIMNSLN